MNTKTKAMLASYARSVLGAALALYMSGVTDPKDLWAALLAAFAPVVLRALNPNDPAFGRSVLASEVDEAAKTAIQKAAAKKTTKKTPAKKTTPAKKKGAGGGGTTMRAK